MKFTVILIGIILLIVGVLAYSSIPNIHNIPVQASQTISSPQTIQLNPGYLAEKPENISVFPDKQNQLRVNITVTLESGELSSVQFKLFADNGQNCISNDQRGGCLVNQNVSNETLTIPLNASSTYYFVFDNTGSDTPKRVLFSSSLHGTSFKTIVSNDGSINFVGIGVGAAGLLVALYGVSRKTVIPWE